jgi:DMSO/TMAO reductase YedYZ molybdopterin-dependent catalytic subunit
VTSWFDDRVPGIDPDDWRVDVAGESWSLDSIGGEPHERFDALLDCTGGWYSIQTWDGVRLDHLLEAGDWRSFEVRSATGYSLLFPMRDVSKVYLVTALGGQPLSPGHGFPARIVAPGRRGFWWVKWVVSIQPSTRPWWLQSPFPLT